MKRIIDGKRYDTETAECVGEYSSPHNAGDFHYFEERLYRTKNGAWFIAGEGGARSPYGRSVPGGLGYGDGLELVSEDEARQWLEKHDCDDALEKCFADSIEDA